MNVQTTLILILLSHIISFLIVTNKIRLFKLDIIDINKLYSAISDYISTGSDIIFTASLKNRLEHEDFVSNEVTHNIKILDRELALETFTSKLEDRLDRMEEELYNIELKAVFISSTLVFPPILILISSIVFGNIILSLTPVIQTLLLKIIERRL